MARRSRAAGKRGKPGRPRRGAQMSSTERGRPAGGGGAQLLLRLSPEEARFIDGQVSSKRERPQFIRRLLARARRQAERRRLHDLFARAAAEVTAEDRAERRQLVGGFSNRD